MLRKSFICVATLAVVTGLVASIAAAQITIPTVPIGNPGNAPDPATGGIHGSVAYTYNIGQSEVTNAQYAAFLNAKAASDPLGLYNGNMRGPYGGIMQSGSDGSFTYSILPGRENYPVNFVSFWDAIRFANWLHNGQGDGDTETGAYTVTAVGLIDNTITRNPGWRWAVTSESEWYKAAYYQPANQGGDVDDYWRYPTSTNAVPSAMQANMASGSTTPAGAYASNFSGTFDMGGNLWEWNETILGSPTSAARGMRAGSFNDVEFRLGAEDPSSANPLEEHNYLGFRVVSDSTVVFDPPSTCDDIDFNNDGIENDPADIESFLSVYSGGPCI